MNNGLIITRELPEIARIIEAETRTERQRRGREVSPHDPKVPFHAANRILVGLGEKLRHKYARQADHMAARDKRRNTLKHG